jgi:hypothetical protein
MTTSSAGYQAGYLVGEILAILAAGLLVLGAASGAVYWIVQLVKRRRNVRTPSVSSTAYDAGGPS